MSTLSNFFQFPLPGVRSESESQTLLITDTLTSSSTFLISHFLSRSLKFAQANREKGTWGAGKSRGFPGPRTVLIGIENTFDHYSSLLKKSGLQLPTEQSTGNFVFIDGCRILLHPELDPNSGLHNAGAQESPFLTSARSGLLKLYRSIEQALATENSKGKETERTDNVNEPSHSPSSSTSPRGLNLVIIDDLSSLAWSLGDVHEVSRFFKAVQALCRKANSHLIVNLHADSLRLEEGTGTLEDQDSYLFWAVRELCHIWIETGSLTDQARGELSIRRGPALINLEDINSLRAFSGKTALQYKLEETGTGAVYNHKGSAPGYL